MAQIKFRKQTAEVKITYIVFLFIFVVFAAIYVTPLFWAMMNSLKTGEAYFMDSFGLPKEIHFENYIRVFKDFRYRSYNYFDMLFNSLWQLIVRVVLNVMSSAVFAYAMARFRFPGQKFLYSVVIFAQTIPIIGSGPAQFKLMSALNMIDNPTLMWMAWCGGFDFAFIVLFGNFKGISMTYSEAAKIDGAGNLRVFFQIIFPQAFPCIMAIAITQATSIWNDYSTPMLYLRSYPTLAYGLYLFNSESFYIEDSKPIYFAATIISCIPVIVLYAANQKLILTNVTAGGLKG